jgi:hypothetical protein
LDTPWFNDEIGTGIWLRIPYKDYHKLTTLGKLIKYLEEEQKCLCRIRHFLSTSQKRIWLTEPVLPFIFLKKITLCTPFFDEYYMQLALMRPKLREARNSSVVVCQHRIIAKTCNQTEQLTDVTAHAEILYHGCRCFLFG